MASSLTVCPHCGFIMDDTMNAGATNTSGYSAGPRYRSSTNPHNSIGWPIVALLLFWPCAIASFIYYFKSDEEWNRGNDQGAHHFGELSNKWGKASLWIFIIPVILLIIFIIALLAECV